MSKDTRLSIIYAILIAVSIGCGYFIKDWYFWLLIQQVVFCGVCAFVVVLSFMYRWLYAVSLSGFIMACVFSVMLALKASDDIVTLNTLLGVAIWFAIVYLERTRYKQTN